MSEQYDPFSPHRVDESIEQLSSTGPDDSERLQARIDPNEQLVRAMQQLYSLEREQYQRALKRVENRLVGLSITRRDQLVSSPEGQRGWSTRLRRTLQGSFDPMENRQLSTSGMAKLGRRLGLLAAVLVLIVLVGSLVVVLNYAHRPTGTASGPVGIVTTATTQPTPVPTPQATPTAPGTSKPGRIVYTSPVSHDDFYAFAWSPDGKRVASSTMSQVQIWDATTGKHQLVFVPSGQGGSVLSLAWSPNGRYLAVASGQVQIINPTTGAVIRSFPNPVGFTGSSTSSRLAATNPFSGGNMIYSTSWSPDGSLMASAMNGAAYGNVVVVWNTSTGQIVYTFRGQSSREVASVSWSPDGKYIASADYDGTVKAWNAHTGQVIFSKDASTDGLPYAAWGPGGLTLAFIAGGNSVEVWNVATNHQIASSHAPTGNDLAWSPDGKEIASGSGNDVIIWDATTGDTIYTFTRQGSSARSLAWSPDGKYIVSGGGNEIGSNYAKVWTA